MPLRTEEAYDFLVAHLATIPANIGHHDLARTRYAHIYLPDRVMRFWQARAPPLLLATSRTNTTDPSMTRFGSLPALALFAPAELRQKARRAPTTISGSCGRSRTLDFSGSSMRRSGPTST
jgi:hypothetical protein